jgi:hypothetical protein
VTAAGQALAPDVPPYLGVIADHSEAAPGWLHAMTITVARDELRATWSEQVRNRQVVDIPTDPTFDAVAVDIFLGSPDAPLVRIEQALLVGQLRRLDEGTVAVIARPINLGTPIHIALAPQIQEATIGLRVCGWDGRTPSRLVIFGQDAGEYLRQIEIAVDPD